jgi:tetratricopeptide (TPR) repeat protein
LEWGAPKEEGIGMWNFLWQIILAKELALRLEHYPDASISGFTPRVLASLIVQDLWLRNVKIILTDAKVSLADVKKPETPEERAKAEEFKARGNEAMKNKRYQEAIDLYTEAMKINLSSAVYRANRSAALFSMEKYAEASEDAWVATQLDPKYSKAWARLGIAELKLGNGKRARDAYQRAVEVAGKDATSLMKQGLADAKAKLDADVKAIQTETDKAKKDELRKNYLDEDWDISGKSPELHSHVHEQQVEGLLLFAERMRWPYINEVRDYAEDVYGNLRGGATIPFHLHDWLFGMTLPGKWMSFKVMAALVLCTPSISAKLGTAHYYECGLSLPKQSYWRVRTAIGRVLGCSPGVISLCGWIGPCPPVEFVPPPTEEAQKEPRYVRLKARRVAPIESVADSDDNVIFVDSHHDRYEATRLQPNDEIPTYLAEMKDSSKWVIPEPPVHQVSICTIQSIRLKKLPLDVNVAARSANKELSEIEVDNETQYRASIVFNMDNNEDPVTYTLYTNPVFITPPPCLPGPKGLHEVHVRELPRYQRNIWTVEQLKDHKPEDFDDDVMVINATGKGAEVLARAWCAERGKNAVIRRIRGPCFVCALRAASSGGLGVGILIWVS